jgi:hypothetical protein
MVPGFIKNPSVTIGRKRIVFPVRMIADPSLITETKIAMGAMSFTSSSGIQQRAI